MSLVGWIVSHFLIGLVGTWLARRYALHRRLIDEPGGRRSHAVATPRGGGIAIAAALMLALLTLALRHPAHWRVLLAGALGLLLVATVGWLDDHRPLSAPLRLLAHALAAATLAMAVYYENGDQASACAVFGIGLILVNIWNFMDGIDGLAASQAIIAALGYVLFIGDPLASTLAFALAAAACGFLPFNFPKARIFLGDVGSGSLGFGVAAILAIAISAEHKLPVPAQFAMLIPLSAFTVDASLTLLKRIVSGKRWWTAHVEHAYQRWAARMGGHVGVTAAYAACTMLGVCVMLWVQLKSAAFIMITVVAWHVLAVLAWMWLQRGSRVPSEGRRA